MFHYEKSYNVLMLKGNGVFNIAKGGKLVLFKIIYYTILQFIVINYNQIIN